MATKKQCEIAEKEGREAADRGEKGRAPYGDSDRGWSWIYGWEMRMAEIKKDEYAMEKSLQTGADDFTVNLVNGWFKGLRNITE